MEGNMILKQNGGKNSNELLFSTKLDVKYCLHVTSLNTVLHKKNYIRT